MKWVSNFWNQHETTLGVFTLLVDMRGNKWKVSVNGIYAKADFDLADDAKAQAPIIAKAWFTKAMRDLESGNK